MSQPDFERAKAYAFQQLEERLPPTTYYHSIRHTRDDVFPAVEQLAALEGIEGDELLCLRTAACYHDLGYVEHHENHEASSARMAAEVLPGFGYLPVQLELIRSLIMATKWPPHPHTLLEKIIADADMDSLGRDDFLAASLALRREQEARNVKVTDEEWYSSQVEFLKSHEYFTRAAHYLRDSGKERNIALVQKLLEEMRSSKK